MGEELLKVVDTYCNFIRGKEKLNVHKCGDLHEAVSVIIFNTHGEVLIQKRSEKKYHSGGKWANSCCTHVRVGEEISDAVTRCMKEELGLYVKTFPWFDFIYHSCLSNNLVEYEYDHVFWGFETQDLEIKTNEEEVQEHKWITLEYLLNCSNQKDDFAPWFQYICSIINSLQDNTMFEQKECYTVRKLYQRNIPKVQDWVKLRNLNNTKELYNKIEPEIKQLCSKESMNNIEKIVKSIAYFVPSKIVLEENLSQQTNEIDFSICIPKENTSVEKGQFEWIASVDVENAEKWDKLKEGITFMEHGEDVDEIWLEFDNCQGNIENPLPCFFYDAYHLNKNSLYMAEQSSVLELLKKFLTMEKDQEQSFKEFISQILDNIELYQLGILLSRNDTKKVRIYTKMFSFQELERVISCSKWKGNINNLIDTGKRLHTQHVDLSFTYDLEKKVVLDEIGLSMYVPDNKAIQVLYDLNYIDEEKLGIYSNWNKKMIERKPDNSLLMYVRKFGYIKATFNKEELLTIKSYLYYSQYLHQQNNKVHRSEECGENNQI